MWLIDTTTLQLEWRIEAQVGPPYAILSHTWGVGEVTFADIQDRKKAETKAGWHKIEQTCELARSEGYRYAWVDTCCIDKSSSAELSEAINSMFEWYRLSGTCYAWLEDWAGAGEEQLSNCRWFTRGWTLQELIAPPSLYFYDGDWVCRGSKALLHQILHRITNVDIDILLGRQQLSEVPVGRRMSWAAFRQTTRQEDAAYCLLGIFGVNLPMIYGEGGPRAFLRLQEEIARSSSDLSLFAWEPTESAVGQEFSGMLASSPRDFAKCSNITHVKTQFRQEGGFVITNQGLEVQTNRFVIVNNIQNSTSPVLALWCTRPPTRLGMLVIPITKVHSGFVRRAYGRLGRQHLPSGLLLPQLELRLGAGTPIFYETPAAEDYFGPHPPKTVRLSKTLSAASLPALYESMKRGFLVNMPAGLTHLYSVRCHPQGLWDPERSLFYTVEDERFVGLIAIKEREGQGAELPIACGFEKALGGAWACVLPPTGQQPLGSSSLWMATDYFAAYPTIEAEHMSALAAWRLLDRMRQHSKQSTGFPSPR